MSDSISPGTIVRDYLEENFLLHSGTGERLPTISKLAAQLKVSTTTVRTVIRELVAEGRLCSRQGRGTFVISEPGREAVSSLSLATNRFRLNPEHAPNWIEVIYLGAIEMAARMPQRISILPLDAASPAMALRETREEVLRQAEEVHGELIRRIDEIDMLILFPWQGHDTVRSAYEAEGKAVVEINPPDFDATANFVSAVFYRAAHRIGSAWYNTGRRRILFLGRLDQSVSTESYLMGLSIGVRRDHDPEVQFQVVPVDPYESPEAVLTILRNAPFVPTAVFCASDVVGANAISAFREMGLSVPEEVSVVGGTGFINSYFGNDDITRVLQPMNEIGANAIRVVCHRIENQNVSVPGIYLSTSIHCGTTTRAEENRHIEASDY